MDFHTSKNGLILNRRTALKLAGASSMAAIAGLSSTSVARAATPKRGGTLKIAMSQGSTTESLDPATYLDTHMFFVGFTLGNALVEIGPDRAPKPELAESWEGSPDAKKWTFKIRKGVQFHNGKELTPQDVVYSLTRHIGADSKSAAKGFLANVTSITGDGDTVVIELSAGDADIPIIMGDFHLQIVPDGFADWTKFVGTGPYILESFNPGINLVAKRNPNYWKSDRAWVDAVEVLFIPDATARLNALTGGEVHVIDRVDSKIVEQLKGMNAYNIVEGVGGRYETSVMDVRKAPFNDANVRLAVKYAIDRQEIVEKVFQGYASVGNDHPIPPMDPFFHTELPQRSYDPDKAREPLIY